ncbi:hypothetical protein M501DRAFT_680141 [Patellaria atrata CBS 101060]|uniref:RBR-type E3 ubiquitin transferase n=1 Tax=Patellaria atrata CBS 101060 TaxID=1346257 RepID=A0A9P4VU24_9PEZI|nr:hypothetical protein M501DRAFT_680141 [Patellaria atrata CBS 101060]
MGQILARLVSILKSEDQHPSFRVTRSTYGTVRSHHNPPSTTGHRRREGDDDVCTGGHAQLYGRGQKSSGKEGKRKWPSTFRDTKRRSGHVSDSQIRNRTKDGRSGGASERAGLFASSGKRSGKGSLGDRKDHGNRSDTDLSSSKQPRRSNSTDIRSGVDGPDQPSLKRVPRTTRKTPPGASSDVERKQKHSNKADREHIRQDSLLDVQEPLNPRKKNPQQTFECMICTDTLPLDRFPGRAPTRQCNHSAHTCRKCLRHWIDSEFKVKIWNQIGCPECWQPLRMRDMKKFAPKEVTKRYEYLHDRHVRSQTKNFMWCPSLHCEEGQVHNPKNPKFTCNKCGYKFCVAHNIPWHSSESCKEFNRRQSQKRRKEENEQSVKFVEGNFKKCECGWWIEKNDGCDHMTCTKCRREFCYSCLAPYKPIRDHGNRMHNVGCQYHM